MSDNTKLYDMAALAEASYVFFDKLKDYSDESVADALQISELEGKFSATQADDFVSHWQVVSHLPNTSSGFSATLFKNKQTGEYVFAVRGTEATSFIKDWGLTDFADIVRDGVALDEIVDMYNYWQQLNSPKTPYKVAVLETDKALTAACYAAKMAGPVAYLDYTKYLHSRTDVVIDEPLGKVRKIDLTKYSTDIYKDERCYGLDLNPASVTVVGHSMGVHLAAVFSRLFPGAADNYESAYERRLAVCSH